MAKRTRASAEHVALFGFRWNQTDVTRVCGDRRGHILEIDTGCKRITVWVSAQGRSIRVYREDGAELVASNPTGGIAPRQRRERGE